MKKVIYLFLFLIFSKHSHALYYMNYSFQLTGGNIKELNENINSTIVPHDGWHYGVGLSARIGVNLNAVKFGAVGDYHRLQYEGERKDINPSSELDDDEDYDNVVNRTLFGGFVMVELTPIYFIGEFYTSAAGKMAYSENTPENIFNKGDKIEGSGWGLGFGYRHSKSNSTSGLMLRRIEYDHFNLSGVETDLPNTRFENELLTWEVSLQFGITFE